MRLIANDWGYELTWFDSGSISGKLIHIEEGKMVDPPDGATEVFILSGHVDIIKQDKNCKISTQSCRENLTIFIDSNIIKFVAITETELLIVIPSRTHIPDLYNSM